MSHNGDILVEDIYLLKKETQCSAIAPRLLKQPSSPTKGPQDKCWNSLEDLNVFKFNASTSSSVKFKLVLH